MAYKNANDPRSREAKLRWYRKNKEKQIKRQSERKKELLAWVRSYKTSCNRCGFDHPAALVFHHLDPSEKELSVAAAITQGWGKSKLKAEIDKCEVVCTNCHAIEHLG